MTEEGEVLARLAAVAPEHREEALFILPPGLRMRLMQDWGSWAHAGQVAPPGDWRVWLIRAGRGFGKTRAGAEWVAAYARENAKARIALVGDTAGEVRKIMIEGASGLIAVAGATDKIEWRASAGEVTFGSGAKAYVYSANAPEALRGPEHHIAWCDELAKWRYGDAAWDNLMLGLRIGDRPRALVTTTPRPTMLMRRVWDASAQQVLRFIAGSWEIGIIPARRIVIGGTPVLGAQQPAVPTPSGGNVIDIEVRRAIAAMLVALRAHGLIAP